jgi:hypothetical protein
MSEQSVCYLSRLEEWYSHRCDGSWEQRYGVSVESSDNPGWILRIDVPEIPSVYSKQFENVAWDGSLPPNQHWIVCEVTDGQFRGAGWSIRAVLEVFFDWFEELRRKQPTLET